jgi:hypothetical protein
MPAFEKFDDPRRRLLVQALAAGFCASGLPRGAASAVELFGRPPSKLPAGQSFYRIEGQVRVNGDDANLNSRVAPGDTVETGARSEAVFVVERSAFILRSDSRLTIETPAEDSLVRSALRLTTGALLSVYPSGYPTRLTTSTATIGVRGTGLYLESDPGQTYFCTCYGVADVAANDDPGSRDTVTSEHHDRPLYIVAGAQPGQSIRAAPFLNHTDQELMLIETLVGREPPFVFPGDAYDAPRRDY